MRFNERRAAFTLRLWQDEGSQPAVWRSEIIHVQSGARAHCTGLPALFRQMQSFLGALEADDLTSHGQE